MTDAPRYMKYPVIWLEPDCEGCEDDRAWSHSNEWPAGCEECGEMPVKYVLAPDQPERPEPEQDEDE
jgi:hypothetical protein